MLPTTNREPYVAIIPKSPDEVQADLKKLGVTPNAVFRHETNPNQTMVTIYVEGETGYKKLIEYERSCKQPTNGIPIPAISDLSEFKTKIMGRD